MGPNVNESEEDTKNRYITPALAKAGWGSLDMMMEYSLKADRFKIVPGERVIKIKQSQREKPDYVLLRGANCPVAVVEAKKSSLTASDGIDQAIRYAEILDVQFAYSTSGKDFIEFDRHTGVQRTFPLEQFPTKEELLARWRRDHDVSSEDLKQLQTANYYTTTNSWTPRYYQMVAINKVVEAVITQKRKRLLLVMATGTGKTYTAFQIVWRLKKAGAVTNVLYLADRNQLVDQSIIGDFHPCKSVTKIQNGNIDKNFEIYFGLYQQLKGRPGASDENEDGDSSADGGESFADNFRQVSPNFFDFIIVDECHRGSAKEESSWREILEYFKSATQLGMTATPNRKEGADNAEYFGEPLYTYSLKQGIEDGFLAPYMVKRICLDKDRDGWEPMPGELDDDGKPIPQRKYTLRDFDSNLVLKERTMAVAQAVTSYLEHIGPMSKTIVFCTTEKAAARMRDAIRALNPEQCKIDATYCVRMTGSDIDGKKLYDAFTSVSEPYPVIATTSKLLTTGADTKCVKLIVLDTNIASMTEFKQIIGRGTRLREDAGKTHFTIMDFRGATQLFYDPEWDGDEGGVATKPGHGGGEGGGGGGVDPQETYTKSDVGVAVVSVATSFIDENGKLVIDKFEDYSRRSMLELFGESQAKFIELWNRPEERREVVRSLAEKGISLEELKNAMGNPDIDEFDLICQVAYGGGEKMTRALRANKARQSRFLEKYQGVAREVLELLLDRYARLGVTEVDSVAALNDTAFGEFGGKVSIIKTFGGKERYMDAVNDLVAHLYGPSNQSIQTEARA